MDARLVYLVIQSMKYVLLHVADIMKPDRGPQRAGHTVVVHETGQRVLYVNGCRQGRVQHGASRVEHVAVGGGGVAYGVDVGSVEHFLHQLADVHV